MGSYAVSLEKFEGPLDLLLHLIQKHKIDIYEIPIAEITQQYLAHIEKWQALDMEVAGEFIVMAARLLEIKSRTLLPGKQNEEASEEALKERLVKQLIDYKVFKNISLYLEKREVAERGAVYREPEYLPELVSEKEMTIDPEDLKKAFSSAFSAYREALILKNETQEIVREVYTVEEKIADIRQRLKTLECGKTLCFSGLLPEKVQRAEVIVTFMALLELYKMNQIILFQDHLFQEIRIQQKVEK